MTKKKEPQEVFYDEFGQEIIGTGDDTLRCWSCGHAFDGPSEWANINAWSAHQSAGCEVVTVSPTGVVTTRKPYPGRR